MRSFFEWFRESPSRAEPWLVFGKGPSFSRRGEYDLAAYNLVALNHVVREQPVLLAHVIDLDVVELCADVLERNAQFLVMPWYPHVRNKVGKKSLEELAAEVPVLGRLEREGRLLYYDFSTAKQRRGGGPTVQASYFSAEAVLTLLALAGARTVRSLGVDGGVGYGGEFVDLKDKTLLNNGHKTFDIQFQGFARTIMNTGIDYAPLNVESPVRVYVGSTEAQMLAVKVLEYSIRKHASMSVEVFPLHRANVQPYPTPKDVANRPRTPFSFQRFYIPQLAGYRGRAIYVDSDMQVFQDIRKLWTVPFDGADLLAARERGDDGRRPQFAVMLLNCEALRWDLNDIVARLDSGELTYETLMYQMAVAKDVRAAIDATWNSLERYDEGETALLHYTDMTTQPWISRQNKLGYLWVRDLIEAVDKGFITMDYIREHVAQGWVRPSVVYQVEQRVEDPLLLPKAARALDDAFVAPYQTMGAHGGQRSLPLRVVRAALRRAYERSGLQWLQRGVRKRLAS